MSILRHNQRAITSVLPHMGNRRIAIPNHPAPSLPPALGTVWAGALTPDELSVTVTRTGYDSRVSGDGAMGQFSYSPGQFNDEPVEFLFYHWNNDTFYFGSDLDNQYTFTQDPVQVAIQGLGFNFSMNWNAQGYWVQEGPAANLIGKYLRTRLGVKLAVLVGQ